MLESAFAGKAPLSPRSGAPERLKTFAFPALAPRCAAGVENVFSRARANVAPDLVHRGSMPAERARDGGVTAARPRGIAQKRVRRRDNCPSRRQPVCTLRSKKK